MSDTTVVYSVTIDRRDLWIVDRALGELCRAAEADATVVCGGDHELEEHSPRKRDEARVWVARCEAVRQCWIAGVMT